jgi:hypothetical protein
MANKASLGFIEVRVGGRKEESCGGCRVKPEPRITRGFPGELDNNMVVKYQELCHRDYLVSTIRFSLISTINKLIILVSNYF